MRRVLIASPVRQKPVVLQEFLLSLERLERGDCIVDYAFVDDHAEENPLLAEFSGTRGNVHLFDGEGAGVYHCDEMTHYWQEQLMWKVARYKDLLIEFAIDKDYDFSFFVDSDLVLHPKTLMHLLSLSKDIVSEVFWTKWKPEASLLPQVWLGGHYRLYRLARGETIDETEMYRRQRDFLEMLKCPGVYKVGGLGACTLLSRKALRAGARFREIYNLELAGEDRHFCVRAAALGFSLYADTCYPPYHIYRESELAGLAAHLERYDFAAKRDRPRLTLAMLVRNEADRYLREVLTHALQYVDEVVILDDASTDNTVAICRECAKDKLRNLISNATPGFNNEVVLRQQLWDMAVQTGAEWILILDADEMFEDKVRELLPQMLENPDVDVYSFRLYDMWGKNVYREDTFWQAHKTYRPFLVRSRPGHAYVWNEIPLHCGRYPCSVFRMPTALSQLRVKHFGWMRAVDRIDKFQRYKILDPEARYGIKEQYASILDPHPLLVTWEDGEE